MTRTALRRAAGAWRGEDGSATIEFVLLFPVFMAIFLSAFESGMLMARSLMLERGTDIAVRDLRISDPETVTLDAVKERVCDAAMILGDCRTAIRVELVPAALGGDRFIGDDVECTDADERILFDKGSGDQLMMVRVCVPAPLFMPTTGLGLMLPKTPEGDYAFVTTSAFVNEPSR